MDAEFIARLSARAAETQLFLEKLLDERPRAGEIARPERLLAAMRHGALNGGKRLRSILVYASGATLGVPLARLDAVAAAVEMIHAYSLIHDDLPAMDNDDLRHLSH